MSDSAFTLFDTAIGACGLAWRDDLIIGVQLPEADREATAARLAQRFPATRAARAPARWRGIIADITAVLQGQARDLRAAALDYTGVPPFQRRVYEAARAIPPGATLSYGELAQRMDATGAARAVGQALGRNPFPIIVPCHRVLAAGGKVGGFTAAGGTATKQRMLAIEGARSPAPLSAHTRIFAFDTEAALGHLRASDRRLGAMIDTIGAFRMEITPSASIFAALTQAIVHQQLHTKAAATIYARLCALFPRSGHLPSPARLQRLDDDTLRGVGLSRNKLLAMRDLAARSLAGEIPTMADVAQMDDKAIIERLTAVRGIGRWTTEMLLMFRLGRPDVLPVDDLGIRAGFAATLRKRELPAPREVARHGLRWAPYRTIASWYLWRAADRAKSETGAGSARRRDRS